MAYVAPTPFSSANKFSAVWPQGSPFNIINGYGFVPSNGDFIPTVQQPQLSMELTHIGTGCKHTYKSVKYLIGDSKMDLKVMRNKSGMVCQGEPVCLDVTFNLHLLPGQEGPHLEPLVKVAYTLKNQSDPSQTSVNGTLVLPLKNSAGLYQASLCIDNYTTTEGTYNFTANLVDPRQFGPQEYPYNWLTSGIGNSFDF